MRCFSERGGTRPFIRKLRVFIELRHWLQKLQALVRGPCPWSRKLLRSRSDPEVDRALVLVPARCASMRRAWQPQPLLAAASYTIDTAVARLPSDRRKQTGWLGVLIGTISGSASLCTISGTLKIARLRAGVARQLAKVVVATYCCRKAPTIGILSLCFQRFLLLSLLIFLVTLISGTSKRGLSMSERTGCVLHYPLAMGNVDQPVRKGVHAFRHRKVYGQRVQRQAL